MIAFLKSRTFLTVVGLLLLALFIWFVGPYIFAEPLATWWGRLILIVLVVLVWAAIVFIKRMKANRASDKLIGEVVKQSGTGKESSAEAAQLRERFEEAVATLKQKRKGGQSLYELPWYVIIGAPGSGKTTALVNSGLNFPLEQRTGKGALRGVGGTRNCDWWFTDEAVLLDTAGRYTTQDSDEASDSAGWSEFLALLRKYRKRRPLNGVILTISAQDLMTQDESGREAHLLAARRRLNELNKELKIQLPVYLMVTKCDLVAGFTEYFEDLAQDGRAQVWGVTFPYDVTVKGGAADGCPAEFDALIARLNERVYARLEDERDVRRRTKIFGFPQQMAALRESLMEFVSEVFGGTRFDQRVLFRGLYFTSGTQQGNPVDRLLGSIGRRFAIAPDAVAPATGKGRAYFIQRLLKDVLFAESGLAGVNRRMEALKATGQLSIYLGIGLLVVLSIVAWSVSYSRNQTYLGEVREAANLVESASAADASDLPLNRLNAIRAVYDAANQYQKSTPWLMRFWLYQGGRIGAAAETAYAGVLNGAMLPLVAERFRQELISHPGEPALVYEYLKAYLMLKEPKHLDKDRLARIAEDVWNTTYASDPPGRAAAAKHFQFLLDHKALRSLPVDESVVSNARRLLQTASQPAVIYQYIRINYMDGALKLNQLGTESVLKRKSGASFADPVPSIYTKKIFEEISAKDINQSVVQFLREDWVWGESRDVNSILGSPALASQVIELYEADYIRYWQGLLDDIATAPASPAQTKDNIATLSGPGSPLRTLLKVVDDNTYFAAPADQPPSVAGGIDKLLQSGRKAIGVPTVQPGAQITAHFAQLHALMAGPPGTAPIDGVLAKLGDLGQKMPAGSSVGGTDPANAQAVQSVQAAGKALLSDAKMLPAGLGTVVAESASSAMGGARTGMSSAVTSTYQQQVVMPCGKYLDGRYPFAPNSTTDVLAEDFEAVFGASGLYNTYFKSNLETMVDISGQQWKFKQYSTGESLGLSDAMLQRFRQARQIQEHFFSSGKGLSVRFSVFPTDLSKNAQQFQLEADGNPKLDYRNQSFSPLAWRWPGPGPDGAAVTFVGLDNSHPEPAQFQGPWALFRLLDSGRLQPTPDAAVTRLTLTSSTGGFSATIELRSTTVNNPFAVRSTLKEFRCQ